MHSAIIFLWAVAPCLALQRPPALYGRQGVVQSQATQISEEHIATSFSQVTETYSSISTYFVETSRTLVSQTTIQEAGATLTQFQQRITQAVEAISGGCDCALDGVNTETIQTTIVTWFVQLQSMVQYCQRRFPTQYQSSFGSTFERISTQMQVALGVAYAAGVNVDTIVSRAVQKAQVNPKLLASVNIHTHQFTQISKAVSSQTGVFAKTPAPVGPRFPDRLKKVIQDGKHRGLTPPSNSTRKGAPAGPADAHQATSTRAGKHGVPADSHQANPAGSSHNSSAIPNAHNPITGKPTHRKPTHNKPGSANDPVPVNRGPDSPDKGHDSIPGTRNPHLPAPSGPGGSAHPAQPAVNPWNPGKKSGAPAYAPVTKPPSTAAPWGASSGAPSGNGNRSGNPGSHHSRPRVPTLDEPKIPTGGFTADAPSSPPHIADGAPGSLAAHMPRPAAQPAPAHPLIGTRSIVRPIRRYRAALKPAAPQTHCC